MHISRIQVEEGFLDGLDLRLRQGLVTLIGARGTGKTSLIELIRFCLDVPGYTPESGRRSREHALSVLGSGQVTLTLWDGRREITVTRTAAEDTPRSSAPFATPIVFSQTEIENVGMQPGGRLRLLDSFLGERTAAEREEAAAVAEVRSLMLEVSALRREAEDLRARQGELASVNAALAALAPKENALAAVSQEANQKAKELSEITEITSHNIVARDALTSFIEVTDGMIGDVRSALIRSQRARGSSDPADIVAEPAKRVDAAVSALQVALNELGNARQSAAESAGTVQGQTLALEEQARQIRRVIEELQTGAGSTMRSAQQFREKKAQLEALASTLEVREVSLRQLMAQRDSALDRLEHVREGRYNARTAAIRILNKALGPRIRLGLDRSAQREVFAAQLADLLKGSGVRYNDLSDALSASVSPRELLEAVETNNVGLLCESTNITPDRIFKVITALKDADLGLLSTVLIEDDVRFELLDGGDYKDIGELSTGQRCTVVLPIVLQHKDRLIVVDQPEDHIDNAFIADTLIKSIIGRDPQGQIIFSTHNANVPVLGEADWVIEMDSDGKRGFAKVAQPLDDTAAVYAISSIMEGGADAFKRRAKFYDRHAST